MVKAFKQSGHCDGFGDASLEAFCDLLGSLEEANVPHAYWKASRRLEDSLRGQGDFDLLVGENRHWQWLPVLQAHGFVPHRPQQANDHEKMSHYVSAVGIDGEQLVHLHVHEAPISGECGVWEYCLGNSDEILAETIKDSSFGIYRLRPAMEAILLSVRSFTEPKMRVSPGGIGLTDKARKDIDYVWQRVDRSSLYRVAASFLGPEIAECFVELFDAKLSPGELAGQAYLKPHIEALLPRFKSRSEKQVLMARTRRRVLGYSRTAYQKLGFNFFPDWRKYKGLRSSEAGLFVAVVGPDGAGKSTLTTHLEEWAKQTLDTERIYLGKGNIVSEVWSHLATIKWRLITGLTGQRPPLASTADIDVEEIDVEELEISEENSEDLGDISSFDVERTPIRQRFWELSRVAQAARQLRTARRAREHKAAGRVMITDRFPHHRERFGGGPGIVVDQKDGLWTLLAARAERRLLTKVTHEQGPDVVIRLSISAAAAWKRKPDHSFSEIRRKVDTMERISYPDAEEYVLDATEPLEVVQGKARKIIWEYLQR